MSTKVKIAATAQVFLMGLLSKVFPHLLDDEANTHLVHTAYNAATVFHAQKMPAAVETTARDIMQILLKKSDAQAITDEQLKDTAIKAITLATAFHKKE